MREAQLLAALGVERVGLVEHEQARAVARPDLLEDVLDRAQHLVHLLLGDRRVDDVQHEVGHRVSSSVAPNASTSWWGSLRMKPTVSVIRYGRPLRRSERVVGSSVWNSRSRTPTRRPGERVEQRRLARVRVAGERDLRQVRALALGAHHRARGLDVAQLAPQRRDAVAREAAVGLDLGLAGAAGADAAAEAGAEALEVRPQAAHAREVVLELGELDLELALRAVRVAGEDVEDDRRAVDDRHAQLALEVALLARRELVVAGDEVRVAALAAALTSSSLPGPR